MKIESFHSSEEKVKYKIIRSDSLTDVVCDEINAADEDTGECSVTIKGETKALHFGPGGIKIVKRGRG